MKQVEHSDAGKKPSTHSLIRNAKRESLLDVSGKEPLLDASTEPDEQPANQKIFYKENLIRLFYKRGEFIYARPDDIVMVESSDHLINIYIIHEDKIKKTIRSNSLKDFLAQLPENQFLRIGRFCVINLKRLSGGNCKEQTFEFDFKVSIKLKHAIPPSWFNDIGR
jgi:DNA-binding LytR/AlgR family response regulator